MIPFQPNDATDQQLEQALFEGCEHFGYEQCAAYVLIKRERWDIVGKARRSHRSETSSAVKIAFKLYEKWNREEKWLS